MRNFILDQSYQKQDENNPEHEYANITFKSIEKLKCRGRHIFMTLWILSLWRGIGANNKGWFFIFPHILNRYNITAKEFYRAKQRLAELGVIEIKYKCGPGGTNLYRFKLN